MPKCPNCKSRNTHCTNWDERLGGSLAGSAAGFFMGFVSPSMSSAAHYQTSKNVCPYKKYKCDDCGHDWWVSR